jgi:molecular chaperone DnaK (HSP70)
VSSGPRYVVGIDLGTTNCAVAWAEIAAANGASADELGGAVAPFPMAQLVAPGEVAERPMLPSFLLLPTPLEVAPEAMALPWNPAPGHAVGEMARERGAELPQRLVSSAKSWLSHTGVDRNAPILPWRGSVSQPGGDDGDDQAEGALRVSPVEASARYLAHIRDAWNAAHPGAPLAAQEVLLTVPASFDAVARELTVQAARQAGLDHVTLLEEPQAAFYAWLAEHGGSRPGAAQVSGQASDQESGQVSGDRDWRKLLAPGDVVLVCDIGGGTTDFSLIAVTDDGHGNLALERVAVGDHILLGGDNIDLALAHVLMQRLGEKGKKLQGRQQRALVHACRRAKETLLGADAPASVPISILGTGSKLIGGTLRTEVTREDIENLVLGGFFPEVPAGARPQARRAVGLVELGLSYAQDAAVTRHLAAFLDRHQRTPSAILFNGGVMKSPLLQERVAAVVGSWGQGQGRDRVRVLASASLDLAVAHGAAYYGLVRRGQGIRIRGGTARAYYIGVESAMPAIPGFAPPIKALCVAPFGMEEGTAVDVPGEELGLVVGERAEFRFFAASHRKHDPAGAVCDPDDDGLAELDPVEATLAPWAEGGEEHRAGEVVPVTLRAQVTEIGTLALWCVARDRRRQWKLEYSVRDANQG